ncbi:MAG: pyruvate ferredoxin oxidoreductase [Chloroflexi bacterium RBG_16_56_11]|nr:MAG: pyruvate ferredoxin oxidoreductase [Chloroflexi bacterium RBG_16_56_11]
MFKTESPWSNGKGVLLKLDTGSWRTERPVLDVSKCNYCGLCALYCPPQCMFDRGDHFEANLAFCKGCGICAKECPRGAYKMVPEGEFANEG